MAKPGKAEIVITALDRASATLQRIGDKFDQIGKPIGRVQQAIGRLSDASGLTALGSAAISVAGKLRNLLAVSAGLGAAYGAVVGGLFMLAQRAADAVDKVGDLSSRFGVATQDVQVFGGFVEEAGGSMDDAAKALGKLNKNMSQARAGSKQMQAAFASAGISMADLRDKTPAEVLFKMADAAKASEKEGAKLATLESVMGKSGSIMLDALNKGGDEIRARYKEMTEDGILYTEEQIAQADAFDKSWKRMTRTVEGVRNAIGMRLASALTPFIERLQAWISANRALLDSKIDAFIAALPALLENGVKVLTALWNITVKVVSAFTWMIDTLGATNAILLVIVPLFAPLALAVLQLGAAFANVAWVLGNGLLVVFPKLITALRALGAAMLANPVLLVITLIAAAAFLLWRNWDTVITALKGAWQSLSDTVAAVWVRLGAIVQGGVESMRTWFGGMYDGFVNVWERIAAWFGEKLRALTSMLPSWLTGGLAGPSVSVNASPGGQAAPGSAARTIAGGAPQRQEVGGVLKIQIDGAPAKVTEMRAANPNMQLQVAAGQHAYG